MSTTILKLIGRLSAALFVAFLLAGCGQPSDAGTEDRGQDSSGSLDSPNLGTIGNPYTPGGGDDTCQPGSQTLDCQRQSCAADAAQTICADLCANSNSGGVFSCNKANVCTTGAVLTHNYCKTPPTEPTCNASNAAITAGCLAKCDNTSNAPSFCSDIETNCLSASPTLDCSKICASSSSTGFSFCSDGEFCVVGTIASNQNCQAQCAVDNTLPFCVEACQVPNADFDFCTEKTCEALDLLCKVNSCDKNPQQSMCADICADDDLSSQVNFCDQVCEGGKVNHSYCDVTCSIENAASEPVCMAKCEAENPPGYCNQLCEAGSGASFCSGGFLCTLHTVNATTSNPDCSNQCNTANPPNFCAGLCAPEGSSLTFNFCVKGEVCQLNNANTSAYKTTCEALCNVASPPSFCAGSYCVGVTNAADMPDYCSNICNSNYGYQFCETICDDDPDHLFCGQIISCEQDHNQPKCEASCAKTAEGDKPVYCISLCDDSSNGYAFCNDSNQKVLGVTLEAPSKFKFVWRRAVSDTSKYYVIKGNSNNSSLSWQTVHLDDSARSYKMDQAMYDDQWTKNTTYHLYGCPTTDDCTNDNRYRLDSTAWVDSTDNRLEGIGYLKSQIKDGVAYADEEFGRHIALSRDGRVMAVSTRGSLAEDSGAFDEFNVGGVQMFYRTGLGAWTYASLVQPQELLDNRAGDPDPEFGRSVSLSDNGEYMVVGAPGKNLNGKVDVGAIYFYQRQSNMTEWKLLYSVHSPLNNEKAYFGASVSLSDDGKTFAVGAPNNVNSTYGNNSLRTGSAFMFFRNDLGQLTSYKTFEPAASIDNPMSNYGQSVSLSGVANALAVGTEYQDSYTRGLIHPVYLYLKKSDTNDWNVRGSWGNPTLASVSVNLSQNGQTLVISSAEISEVYIAKGVDCAVSECTKIPYPYQYDYEFENDTYSYALEATNTSSDNFGGTVVMNDDGSRIAVSAQLDDDHAYGVSESGRAGDLAATKDSGAVFIFEQTSNDTWAQTAYIKAANPGIGDKFGTGLAMSGDGATLVVGAPQEDRAITEETGDQSDTNTLIVSGEQIRSNDNDSLTNSGAVYLY